MIISSIAIHVTWMIIPIEGLMTTMIWGKETFHSIAEGRTNRRKTSLNRTRVAEMVIVKVDMINTKKMHTTLAVMIVLGINMTMISIALASTMDFMARNTMDGRGKGNLIIHQERCRIIEDMIMNSTTTSSPTVGRMLMTDTATTTRDMIGIIRGTQTTQTHMDLGGKKRTTTAEAGNSLIEVVIEMDTIVELTTTTSID
mmetsp:Transcript_22083/g.52284  ORF Transcript_22083/g.52284 Transcript_22083/m.52284 type:complete len:200 (-) Transcript_22083:599-1198(-)